MIVTGLFYYLFYTSSGQAHIASQLSSKFSEVVGEKVEVEVKDMVLRPSSLHMQLLVNQTLYTQIKGFLALDGVYDIDYQIEGDRVAFRDVGFDDKINLAGNIKGKMEDFTLVGKGEALEGSVVYSLRYQKEKLRDINTTLNNVNTSKIAMLLGEKPMIDGKCSLEADIAQFSTFEKEGVVEVMVDESHVHQHHVAQKTGLLFPKDFVFSAHLHLILANGVHSFDGDIKSNIGSLVLKDGKIVDRDLKTNVDYMLEIADLSAVQFLTKKRFKGTFEAEGELEYHDSVRFDGKSGSFGGEVAYYFEKGALDVALKDVSLNRFFYAMGYPPFLKGDVWGKANYTLSDDIALINLRSNRMQFRRSKVTERIFKHSGVDFAKEVFTKVLFASSVEGGIVSYDFRAENRDSHLTLFNTKMDSQRNTIESDFNLAMQGEVLSGEIYGSLKSPKVRVDMGKYLEFRAKKEIDEFFGIGTTEKVKEKIKDVDVEDVKGFIKSFF